MWPALGLVLLASLVAAPSARTPAAAATGATSAPSASAPVAFPVGTRILRLLDTSRLARPLHGRPRSRTLETILRYPALGSAGHSTSPMRLQHGPRGALP